MSDTPDNRAILNVDLLASNARLLLRPSTSGGVHFVLRTRDGDVTVDTQTATAILMMRQAMKA